MNVLRGLWGSRTWLALAYVTLGMPAGIVTFTVAVTGIALGVGLVPVFLLGLVLLVAMTYVVRAMGSFERRRAMLILDVALPPRAASAKGGEGVVRRSLAMLVCAATWKEIAYCVLLLPVGTAFFFIAVTVWSVAAAGLTLPAYAWVLPGDEVSTWVQWSTNIELAAGVGIGLLALLTAPAISKALAGAEVAMARRLLSPAGSELLAARVSTLQESRARVVDAADTERRRIERDLHDGAQQHLVALAMNLGMAKEKLDSDPAAARELVTRAHQEAKDSITELRNVVRGVYPAVLTDRGLDAALSALAARSPVPVRVDVALPGRCSPTAEAVAYFVVSEALTNIARHSGARTATVHVAREGDRLRVAVVDDGRGGAALGNGGLRGGGLGGSGLAGLRDRVAAVDGRFTVTSPPGGGTTIAVEVPCES